MPNFNTSPSIVATGTINPSVIIMPDPSRQFGVAQALGVSKLLLGISQPGTKAPPGLITALGGTAPTPEPACAAGDGVVMYTSGDVCGLTVGSAAVTQWDLLTNDGNGNGIPAAAGSGKYVCAIALQSGVNPEVIEVFCLPPGTKA